MTDPKREVKPIRLMLDGAKNTGQATDIDSLQRAVDALRAALFGEPRAAVELNAVASFVSLAKSLDAQFGEDAELPVADAGDAADEALTASAALEQWLARLDLPASMPDLFAVQIGIAYWAMRHGLVLLVLAPVVNALAHRANDAATRQETAAVFALMQGLLAHITPTQGADLERSDPQRPWRMLNLNLAITAIRSGDEAMIRYAFDRLNENLPDERAGFYEESMQIASAPGFPAATRGLIEAECARWSRAH